MCILEVLTLTDQTKISTLKTFNEKYEPTLQNFIFTCFPILDRTFVMNLQRPSLTAKMEKSSLNGERTYLRCS